MLVSDGVVELFNPFHDKLGRFAPRTGAVRVTEKAKEWMDQDIAEVRGRKIKRKHVIAAAGVAAAAAVAVGATVILKKRNMVIRPAADISRHSTWKPVSDIEKRNYETMDRLADRAERDYGEITEKLKKVDKHWDAAYPEGRKLTIYRDRNGFKKAVGLEDVGGAVDNNGNIHIEPNTLLKPRLERMRTLLHEEFHTRSRFDLSNKAIDTKGCVKYIGHEWAEEGLTETLTRVTMPKGYRPIDYKQPNYDIHVGTVTRHLQRISAGDPWVAFRTLDELHKHNASKASLDIYITRDLPRDLNKWGMKSVTKADLDYLKSAFSNEFDPSAHYPGSADDMNRFLRMMQDKVSDVFQFSDIDYETMLSDNGDEDSMEEWEKKITDKYGTIYIPAEEIEKRLKKLEQQKRPKG